MPTDPYIAAMSILVLFVIVGALCFMAGRAGQDKNK